MINQVYITVQDNGELIGCMPNFKQKESRMTTVNFIMPDELKGFNHRVEFKKPNNKKVCSGFLKESEINGRVCASLQMYSGLIDIVGTYSFEFVSTKYVGEDVDDVTFRSDSASFEVIESIMAIEVGENQPDVIGQMKNDITELEEDTKNIKTFVGKSTEEMKDVNSLFKTSIIVGTPLKNKYIHINLEKLFNDLKNGICDARTIEGYGFRICTNKYSGGVTPTIAITLANEIEGGGTIYNQSLGSTTDTEAYVKIPNTNLVEVGNLEVKTIKGNWEGYIEVCLPLSDKVERLEEDLKNSNETLTNTLNTKTRYNINGYFYEDSFINFDDLLINFLDEGVFEFTYDDTDTYNQFIYDIDLFIEWLQGAKKNEMYAIMQDGYGGDISLFYVYNVEIVGTSKVVKGVAINTYSSRLPTTIEFTIDEVQLDTYNFSINIASDRETSEILNDYTINDKYNLRKVKGFSITYNDQYQEEKQYNFEEKVDINDGIVFANSANNKTMLLKPVYVPEDGAFSLKLFNNGSEIDLNEYFSGYSFSNATCYVIFLTRSPFLVEGDNNINIEYRNARIVPMTYEL